MPGHRLLAIARLWLDDDLVRRVLEPLVADWQQDCRDARTARARMLRYLTGAAAFAMAASRCSHGLWPADPGPALRRGMIFAFALFMTLGMAVNVWLMGGLAGMRAYPTESWPFLIPSLVLAAAPYALLPLALLVRARIENVRDGRKLVLAMASATVVLVLIAGGWLVPAANRVWRGIMIDSTRAESPGTGEAQTIRQAFLVTLQRVIASPWSTVPSDRTVTHGTSELTSWELYARDALPADVHAPHGQLLRERHDRVQFAALPIVFAILGWRLGGVSRRVALLRGIAWWIFACLVVLAVRSDIRMLSQTSGWPEPAALWLPLLLFSAAAIVLRPSPVLEA